VLSDELEKAWRERRGSTPIDVEAQFSRHGLVLGAGTVLTPHAQVGDDAASRSRLSILMTVSHPRSPSAGALAHLEKAARRWREGNEALARMHLVLGGLGRLQRSETDARRLVLAEVLLDGDGGAGGPLRLPTEDPGAAPVLVRYSADQLRVPAGSGQWTTSRDGGGANQPAHLKRPPARGPHTAPGRGRPGPQARSRSGAHPTRPAHNGNANASDRSPAGVASLAGVASAGSNGATIDLGRLTEKTLTPLVAFVRGLAPATAAETAGAIVGGFGLALVPTSLATGRWVRVPGPGKHQRLSEPNRSGRQLPIHEGRWRSGGHQVARTRGETSTTPGTGACLLAW